MNNELKIKQIIDKVQRAALPVKAGKQLAVKACFIAFLLFIFTVFISCYTNTKEFKVIDGIPHELDKHGVWKPLWIRSPQILDADAISAVGVYGPTREPEFGREKAIKKARTELSRSFAVRVQNVVKSWAGGSENYFTGSASSQRFTEEITRQTTDVELTGAVMKQFWVHPVTKMNYVLVSVSLDQAQQQAISTVRRVGKVKKDLLVEDKVDEAFKELDEALKRLKSEE